MIVTLDMRAQIFQVTIDVTFPLICLHSPQVYLMKLEDLPYVFN